MIILKPLNVSTLRGQGVNTFCLQVYVWVGKLEAQGPFIAQLITNSKQFSQKKDNQNDRIQINACVDSVVGNTSVCNVCYCEHLVWRRISSKEKPFLYHCFAPPWIQPLEYLAETATRTAAFEVKPFLFEALLTPSCPALDPPQGRSDKNSKHMCGQWELHPYQVS